MMLPSEPAIDDTSRLLRYRDEPSELLVRPESRLGRRTVLTIVLVLIVAIAGWIGSMTIGLQPLWARTQQAGRLVWQDDVFRSQSSSRDKHRSSSSRLGMPDNASQVSVFIASYDNNTHDVQSNMNLTQTEVTNIPVQSALDVVTKPPATGVPISNRANNKISTLVPRQPVQTPMLTNTTVEQHAPNRTVHSLPPTPSFLPQISQSDLSRSSSPNSSGDIGTNLPHPRASKPFAYMFYVTNDIYACAALVFIDRLVHQIGMDSSRIDIVVLHTKSISATARHHFEEQGSIRLIQVDVIVASRGTDPTWAESLTKLRAFQDWGYDRVVSLDADAVPMSNLDHLFKLPPAPLYAPIAYWLEHSKFASTLMVIEPSEQRFQAMLKWAEALGVRAGFDMDILNVFFATSVHYLSGEYTVLNGDLRNPPNTATTLFHNSTELKARTKMIHFSSKPNGDYGKPWSPNARNVTPLEGAGFDPLFRQLFEDFWQAEKRLCRKPFFAGQPNPQHSRFSPAPGQWQTARPTSPRTNGLPDFSPNDHPDPGLWQPTPPKTNGIPGSSRTRNPTDS